MSIFPTKLKPGGTVTLHRRALAKSPAWYQLQHRIIFPDGREIALGEVTFLNVPQPAAPEAMALMKESGQAFQTAPLLMAARYLQHDTRSTDFFLETLVGLRDSSHYYTTYTLPADAPLGRYRYELEHFVSGKRRKSATADSDFFFVEELRLKEVVASGLAKIATIENPSPEPVLADFLQFYDANDSRRPSRELVVLPPRSSTQLSFRGLAILSYLGGTESLYLRLEGDPVCLRNQKYVTVRKTNGLTFVFDGSRELAYELSEKAAEVWELADGFRTRSMIRTSSNEVAYREMVERGHLLEL